MRTPFIESAAGQIEQAIAKLPSEGRRDYGATLEHFVGMSVKAPQNPLAADPARIAAKIFDISQKRRPKYRYHLGVDTRLVSFITRFFPLCLQRSMKHSVFALPATGAQS